MNYRVKDISGKVFNNWTVLSYSRVDSSKRTLWNCQCSCGYLKEVNGYSLVSGNSKSCGCVKNGRPISDQIKDGLSAARNVYAGYRNKAISRGYVFDLSFEHFMTIAQQPCHYCGETNKHTRKLQSHVNDFIYNGIDRKDNSRGYIIDNVLPCCGDCNTAKMSLGYNEFLDLIARIYHNRVVVERSNETSL